MSFAYCRPAIFSPDEAIINARRLLKHPLSIPTDIRLVSTCENLAFRSEFRFATYARDLRQNEISASSSAFCTVSRKTAIY